MSILAQISPDHVFIGLKARTRRKSLCEIGARIAEVTGLDSTVLARALCKKEVRRSSSIGQGVAVLDLQSMRIKKPALCMAVLEHGVDFRAPDEKDVDLIACVLSPHEDGNVHLQRISGVSRLLRDENLCQALRESKDPDAIRLLLMSPERRLYAA